MLDTLRRSAGPDRPSVLCLYSRWIDASNWERVVFGEPDAAGNVPAHMEAAGTGVPRLSPPVWVEQREIQLSAEPVSLTAAESAALQDKLQRRWASAPGVAA